MSDPNAREIGEVGLNGMLSAFGSKKGLEGVLDEIARPTGSTVSCNVPWNQLNRFLEQIRREGFSVLEPAQVSRTLQGADLRGIHLGMPRPMPRVLTVHNDGMRGFWVATPELCESGGLLRVEYDVVNSRYMVNSAASFVPPNGYEPGNSSVLRSVAS